MDLLGLSEHLTAFQLIGSLSDGNRVAGRKGHDRSAQYVYARLKLAGYKPRYGGAAGEQYDPCYHAFCDTLGTLLGVPPAVSMINPATDRNSMRFNVMRGFDQMADAAARPPRSASRRRTATTSPSPQ